MLIKDDDERALRQRRVDRYYSWKRSKGVRQGALQEMECWEGETGWRRRGIQCTGCSIWGVGWLVAGWPLLVLTLLARAV